MNSPEKKCNWLLSAWSITVLGSLLIVAGLVWIMNDFTRPAPLTEDRAAMRRKTLAEVRNAEGEVLNNKNYVWQDQSKGIVRIPIDQAMEQTIRMWQKPVEARTNVFARTAKAFFVPPPAPNKFD